MVKVNISGCDSFVAAADYQNYVQKALTAFDTLQAENGAGNDFLGWKTLPVDIPESLIKEFEDIRDSWKAKGIDIVVVIGNPCKRNFLCLIGNFADRGAGKLVGVRRIR